MLPPSEQPLPETEAPTEPDTVSLTEQETKSPTEPETIAPTESETEAPTQSATSAPGLNEQAIVTVFNGSSVETKIFSVGDTFTVYTTLNAADINGGRISTVTGEQTYTPSVLTVNEELDAEQLIVDTDKVFPVLKDSVICNCAEAGKIYFSASTPSIISKPFLFHRDNSVLSAISYKVTSTGIATVTTALQTLAEADEDLTRIIDKGAIKNPAFTIKSTFENPGSVTYYLGDADGNGDVDAVDATVIRRYTTKVTVNYPEVILMQGDVDGDGELSVVDATIIQRYVTKVKIMYNVGELVS